MALIPEISQTINGLVLFDAARAERFGAAIDKVKACIASSDYEKLDRILFSISDTVQRRALIAWYRDSDFSRFSELVYTYVMIDRMRLQWEQPYTENGEFKTLLYALLSFDDDVLYWHSQCALPLFSRDNGTKALELPGSAEHLILQIRLAMANETGLIAENVEAYFVGEDKYSRKYYEDYLFLRALIRGDSKDISDAISLHLKPKMLRKRNISAGSPWHANVSNLFSGWAVLYVRLANYYGYSVDVKSEWVPDAWVNVFNEDVNPEKKSVLDFVDGFDLFMPLMDNPKAWCPNASKFSPRPKGQPKLTLAELKSGLSE